MVPPPSCRSNRISHPPERYLGILTEDIEEAFFVGDRNVRNDPKTYDEAMLDVDFEKWMEAMKIEIDSMHSNQIWTLVDPSEVLYLLGINRSTKEKFNWMVRQRSIRQGW